MSYISRHITRLTWGISINHCLIFSGISPGLPGGNQSITALYFQANHQAYLEAINQSITVFYFQAYHQAHLGAINQSLSYISRHIKRLTWRQSINHCLIFPDITLGSPSYQSITTLYFQAYHQAYLEATNQSLSYISRHITRLTWRPSRASGCMATRSNSRVWSKSIRSEGRQ